jgi:hypothetical protein
MHTAYRDLTRVRVESAIAAAKAAKDIRHEGTKGQVREIFVRDLLRPLLPNYIGIGIGEVINYQGKHSSQQDVVVYDTRILPPYLADPNVGMFPIESVLYTIEVKSRLTRGELEKAHNTTSSLSDMTYLSDVGKESDEPPKYIPTSPVVPSVFAFDTNLSKKGDTERYDEIWTSKSPAAIALDPSLKAICVCGRGFWWWESGRWNTIPPQTYNFGEVIGYLAYLWNNYERIAVSRGTPRLGQYLLEYESKPTDHDD